MRAAMTCVLVAWGFSGLAGGAERRRFEELLPEDTSFLVTVASVPAAASWFETSPFASAWKSREMEAFAARLAELGRKALSGENERARRLLSDLGDVCMGEVAVAGGGWSEWARQIAAEKRSSGEGSGTVEVPLTVLVDVGDRKEKAQELLDGVIELATEKGEMRKRTDEFRGQRIVTLSERAEGSKEPELSLVLADDLLAASLSRRLLERILAARGEGGGRSLAEVSEFKDLRGGHGKGAAAFAWVDLAGFFEMIPSLMEAQGEGADEVRQYRRVADLLGFPQLRTACVGWKLGETSVDTTAYVLAPGTPRGLLKTMLTRPSALRFPALVPDDVSGAAVLQFDPEALVGLVTDLVKLGAGAMAGGEAPDDQPDPVRMAEQQLGISFRKDLAEPFSGKVVEYERISKPYTENSTQMAFLLELDDRERLEATFEKILGMAPVLEKTSYMGRTVYRLSPGMVGDEGDGGDKAPFAIGFTDTHLVIGAPAGMVDEAIRRAGKDVRSLSDAPGFQAVQDAFPATSVLLGYATPEGLEYLIHMVKEAVGSISSTWDFMDQDLELEPDEDEAEDDEIRREARLEEEDEPGAEESRPPESELEMLEALESLVKALPEASVFTRHLAGTVSWGFVDDRGIGLTSRLLFKKR